MWSGRLPDLDPLETTDNTIIVYDAIIKNHYLKKYNFRPSEVDKLSIILLDVWNKIDKQELEKSQISGTI